MAQERIYISEAARQLNRQIGTIRKWERDGVLPSALVPARDERNRRYWTPKQIEGIKKWLVKTDRRPGKGLKHYKPDAEKIRLHLEHQRGPRGISDGSSSD